MGSDTARGSELFSPEVHRSLLPPSPPWDGASKRFAKPADDPWATPVEASRFTQSANHGEIGLYLRRLAGASADLAVVSLARLANGQDLAMAIVSTAADKTPAGLKATGKPTLFVEAGIHPGESMGVDAGLMLLRDLTVGGGQRALLEKANFLFVPVLNVQGYERRSPNGRMNQHGPDMNGRRANGRWMNLNRDFAKLDSPEIRAIARVFAVWDPDFFIDAHSTDGMNYQYDVTYCNNGPSGLSPHQQKWMDGKLSPALDWALEKLGHIPGPCIDGNDKMSPEAGYYPYFTDGASYSNAYADHRQLPGYLLELHALKPYPQRVLGAYSFYTEIMRILGESRDALREAVARDRAARLDPVPVAWDDAEDPPQVEFKSFEYEVKQNAALGIPQIVWTAEPVTLTVPQTGRTKVKHAVKRPKAYYLPAVWSDVIERLRAHGIEIEVIEGERTLEVTRYRVADAEISNPNREGRATASATPVPETHSVTYRSGDLRIDTDQPLGTLAVALLEPQGEASFFHWGFFNAVLTSHEYAENYVMVPYAERMLAEVPGLAEEFDKKKREDPDFAGNADAVLAWFFARTPFYDDEAYLLPIGIEY